MALLAFVVTAWKLQSFHSLKGGRTRTALDSKQYSRQTLISDFTSYQASVGTGKPRF